MSRQNPNIIITGTPGVGKTTHADLLARETGFTLLNINTIVKDEGFRESRDEELDTWVVDEDKLLDHLEKFLSPTESDNKGGYILDWHCVDIFPESWIDLVIVLRCDSTALYDRLTARGYKGRKLEENMDAEIMQVLLEEARENYEDDVVVELRSDGVDGGEVEGNVERIVEWVRNWRRDRGLEG